MGITQNEILCTFGSNVPIAPEMLRGLGVGVKDRRWKSWLKYPEPEWAELGTAVRVIFYPHPEAVESEASDVPVNVPVNNRQKWFLNQIGKGVRVSTSELAAQWNISQKTAKRDITDLKHKGLIEFLGAPKNGCYRLKSWWLK
jgi:predicted HTH transcriptional regulator